MTVGARKSVTCGFSVPTLNKNGGKRQMRYWVGCTLMAENTQILCELEIGHTRKKKEVWNQTWKRVGGRLEIGDDAGDWMYGRAGMIALVTTALDSDPHWSNPANWLVYLNNVPDRFAEKLGCGEYFSGDGIISRTREKLLWKMWFPCA
jgi:hypothetical protein